MGRLSIAKSLIMLTEMDVMIEQHTALPDDLKKALRICSKELRTGLDIALRVEGRAFNQYLTPRQLTNKQEQKEA